MELGTKTRHSKLLPPEERGLCVWAVPELGEVITLSEACYMWGKSHQAVKNAVLNRKIAARKSFTGGDWLLSVTSMIERYGNPVKDELTCLKLK